MSSHCAPWGKPCPPTSQPGRHSIHHRCPVPRAERIKEQRWARYILLENVQFQTTVGGSRHGHEGEGQGGATYHYWVVLVCPEAHSPPEHHTALLRDTQAFMLVRQHHTMATDLLATQRQRTGPGNHGVCKNPMPCLHSLERKATQSQSAHGKCAGTIGSGRRSGERRPWHRNPPRTWHLECAADCF